MTSRCFAVVDTILCMSISDVLDFSVGRNEHFMSTPAAHDFATYVLCLNLIMSN